MNTRKIVIAGVATVFATAIALAAGPSPTRIAGEKLDSGLGELPHYGEWANHAHLRSMTAMVNRVPGEKLDSGLGELPPYREWAGVRSVQQTASRDMP